MSEQDSHHGNEPAAYDVHATEAKWQPVWDELDPFRADDDSPREKRYALTMFPYPSGDLHMGHAEVTALHDVVARYWWQRGYEVLNPIGWDSFGLPAENAAIRNNEHPATYTYANIETQAESFKKYGVSFDWSRRLHTSDPEYYRWTQWLFLKLRERGLAYRKNSPVNWCPNDQTVLANEQVVDGRCERCGAEVTKRELTQWYFKITDYAQRLLDDMEPLNDTWPERVLNAQRNWIGRSEGAHVDFEVEGHGRRSRSTRPARTRCSARRSSWSRPTRRWPARWSPTSSGRRTRSTWPRCARSPTSTGCRPSGPRPGCSWACTRPTRSTGEQIPVYAADYVLADYGTGAIMAVPGQDQRDWDFAKKFDLPIVRTVQPAEGWEGDAFTGDGPADQLRQRRGLAGRHGRRRGQARRSSPGWRSKGLGRGTVNFRLRDWLLSRQRFWGVPIPVIHCGQCGEVDVPGGPAARRAARAARAPT